MADAMNLRFGGRDDRDDPVFEARNRSRPQSIVTGCKSWKTLNDETVAARPGPNLEVTLREGASSHSLSPPTSHPSHIRPLLLTSHQSRRRRTSRPVP